MVGISLFLPLPLRYPSLTPSLIPAHRSNSHRTNTNMPFKLNFTGFLSQGRDRQEDEVSQPPTEQATVKMLKKHLAEHNDNVIKLKKEIYKKGITKSRRNNKKKALRNEYTKHRKNMKAAGFITTSTPTTLASTSPPASTTAPPPPQHSHPHTLPAFSYNLKWFWEVYRYIRGEQDNLG